MLFCCIIEVIYGINFFRAETIKTAVNRYPVSKKKDATYLDAFPNRGTRVRTTASSVKLSTKRLFVILFLKKLLRLLIKCHQCYAPEHVRRRCKCKPSCSEYALLALDKHSLPHALINIYHRLKHTCRGDYKVDYP